MSARMAAWRAHAYGALSELRLDSARVPALRAPDDVLVRVRAASLNPLDAAMVGGYGARVLRALRAAERCAGAPGGAGELPLVPGRDFAGEVVRAGAAARLRRGAAVWGVVPPHRAGAHAQFVLVSDRWAAPAPRALTALQAGGALYAALSACAVLRAAGLQPGAGPAPRGAPPRVLLLGLGGVGQAALQLLAHSGAETVVGCAAELHPLAAALGAARALDRGAAEYARQLEECGPYDAVLDCAGAGGAEAGARRWRFGRYATLSSPLLRLTEGGLARGAARAGAELAAHNCAAGWPPRVRWAFFAPSAADAETLRRLAERGRFSVAVERVFPWWEGAQAYEQLARGHARGKLLLDWDAAAPPGAAPDAL